MEDQQTLIREASAVIRDCERVLEVATELVDGIPARREEVLKNLAAAREHKREVKQKWRRVINDDNASRDDEWEADREYDRASNAVWRAESALGADDLDPENRKAVARQLAGLVREESYQKLDDIATRSAGDPEVHRTVSESKEEVGRVTYRLISRFREARLLELDERNECRAEAQAILKIQETCKSAR